MEVGIDGFGVMNIRCRKTKVESCLNREEFETYA